MGKGIIIGTNNTSSITEKLDQIYEKLNHSVGDASDSTAIPSNVDEGCIFYNKDGRKIGTLQKMEGVTITPSENIQTINCNDKHMTSDCKINAIPTNHVGSGVTKQTAKTVAPSESEQIAVNGDVYVTGPVKVGSISKTYVGSQVPRQAEKTISPTESELIAVENNSYTTGQIKVAGIPSNYVGSGVDRVNGLTISPTANAQTINTTNKYFSGNITVNPCGIILDKAQLKKEVTLSGINNYVDFHTADLKSYAYDDSYSLLICATASNIYKGNIIMPISTNTSIDAVLYMADLYGNNYIGIYTTIMDWKEIYFQPAALVSSLVNQKLTLDIYNVRALKNDILYGG